MTDREEPAARVRRIVLQRLESLERAGVRQLRRAPRSVERLVAHQAAPTAVEPSPPSQSTSGGRDTLESRQRQLRVLEQEVAGCTACKELARTRTQTVFGVGNPRPRLCFMGEAPGADEDRLGEPFVGRAGKLLTDIIEKGMGLTRDDVYILNVLKCRPPGNRNPAPPEIQCCREFFERQLQILAPEFICCLGTIAAHTLLDTQLSLGKLRGRWHTYENFRVLVTYHPAYLLRNPPMKRETWKDIQLLMKELDLPVPEGAQGGSSTT